MKIFVTVWFRVGGVWYPGEFFQGWAPFQVPEKTVEECQFVADQVDHDTRQWMLQTVGATYVQIVCVEAE